MNEKKINTWLESIESTSNNDVTIDSAMKQYTWWVMMPVK